MSTNTLLPLVCSPTILQKNSHILCCGGPVTVREHHCLRGLPDTLSRRSSFDEPNLGL